MEKLLFRNLPVRYTIILQSGWILISNGSSTVTSFKSSWQNYMIGCRIQIFTLNVPLPSRRTTSKQSMHKVFPFHSSKSRQLHTDIWCYYQINISEYLHFNAIIRGECFLTLTQSISKENSFNSVQYPCNATGCSVMWRTFLTGCKLG